LRRLLNRFIHARVRAIAIGEFDAKFAKITRGSVGVPLPSGDLPFNFVISANFHRLYFRKIRDILAARRFFYFQPTAARTTKCTRHCVDCGKKERN